MKQKAIKRTWKKNAPMDSRSAFRYNVMSARYYIGLADFERRDGSIGRAVELLEKAEQHRHSAMAIARELSW